VIGAAALQRRDAAVIRRLCIVPEALSVTEWADKYRMLPETSTAPGPYRSDITPYVRRPQDLMGDPSVSRVVLCWAAQTTKSTLLENAIGYRIHRTPSPMVVVQPKIDAAEAWAKERLVPMIVATPVLRERVRLGRSSDSTLRYKRFPGGFLFIASAQSATELASRSAPFVLSDEVDRYEVIPGEGNPVEIVERRQGAADIGLHAMTSTPRDAETTNIWPYLEGGTYEFYNVPCPDCGHMQPLEWARLDYKHGAVRYQCRSCESLIDERQKPAMLAAGEWVATNPSGEWPSFHLNALYSPFAKSGWTMLAAEWQRAQGKPADLQVFVNTRLAELWTAGTESLDADSLVSRVEPLEEGVVPEGVGFLTAGVDVQGNRIECYVWGWGAGLESWLVASFVFEGDPSREPDTTGSVWSMLDEVWAREFPHLAGGTMRVAAAFVDSGYATPQVYRYTKRRTARRIHASKGVGTMGKNIVDKPTVQGKERAVVYGVGTDAAKTEFLRSQIRERAVGPGYVHLPDWLTTDQLAQLVAEKRARRVFKGKVVYEWIPKRAGEPNEALDCRVYARAALEAQGTRTIAALGRAAAARAQKAEEEKQNTAPEPPTSPLFRPSNPRPRGGFVRRY
jgi:phage terminase large subunit GpA-like protein